MAVMASGNYSGNCGSASIVMQSVWHLMLSYAAVTVASHAEVCYVLSLIMLRLLLNYEGE